MMKIKMFFLKVLKILGYKCKICFFDISFFFMDNVNDESDGDMVLEVLFSNFEINFLNGRFMINEEVLEVIKNEIRFYLV